MKNVNNFKTKDQFLASTLYALGEKFLYSNWEDGKCYLFFADENKCEKIVSKYYSGELKVDPRIIFDSFKTIKTIIFEKK
jgi:hypothetical protein